MLKTSLIIPVYNEAEYLPKLVNSIRGSGVMPDEILFCDNNSTDASVAVIKNICKGLPYRLLKESRKGIIPTIEKLWRSATGDIILKVDSDSVLPPHWIENTTSHFTENPKLGGCTGPVISSDGLIIHKFIVNTGFFMGTFLYRVVKKHTLLLGPNSAFRKTALQTIDGYRWHEYDLDDQIISRKLYRHNIKTQWFRDMYLYHSTRRYHNKPERYIESLLSMIHPKYYTVKS